MYGSLPLFATTMFGICIVQRIFRTHYLLNILILFRRIMMIWTKNFKIWKN